MIQLKDIGIRKWFGEFNGQMPNLHRESYDQNDAFPDQGAHIGDIAIDFSVTPYKIWQCLKDDPDDYLWIELQQSSGSSFIPIYYKDIAFVDKNGNDNDAQIGNYYKPFSTIEKVLEIINNDDNLDNIVIKIGNGQWNENLNINKSLHFIGSSTNLNNCSFNFNGNDIKIIFDNFTFNNVIFTGQNVDYIDFLNCKIFYDQNINNTLILNEYLIRSSSLLLYNNVFFQGILHFFYNSSIRNVNYLNGTIIGPYNDLNKETITNIKDPIEDKDIVPKKYLKANNITFDNSFSDLTSNDVESAIKEVNEKIFDIKFVYYIENGDSIQQKINEIYNLGIINETNQAIIKIAPGLYQENIDLKPFIHLEGIAQNLSTKILGNFTVNFSHNNPNLELTCFVNNIYILQNNINESLINFSGVHLQSVFFNYCYIQNMSNSHSPINLVNTYGVDSNLCFKNTTIDANLLHHDYFIFYNNLNKLKLINVIIENDNDQSQFLYNNAKTYIYNTRMCGSIRNNNSLVKIYDSYFYIDNNFYDPITLLNNSEIKFNNVVLDIKNNSSQYIINGVGNVHYQNLYYSRNKQLFDPNLNIHEDFILHRAYNIKFRPDNINWNVENVKDALDDLKNSLTDSTQGIKYSEQNFDTLNTNFDPDNENEYTLAIVREDWEDTTNKYGKGINYLFKNGLYRIENNPKEWVFFDNLNLQNASEVPINSINSISSDNVQDALEEIVDKINQKRTFTYITYNVNNVNIDITKDVILLDGSNNDVNAILPPTSGNGQNFIVKAINITHQVKLKTYDSLTEKIDDATEYQFMTKNESIRVIDVGTGWIIAP